MAGQTRKQKYRQKFGYYMEGLVSRYFEAEGGYALSYGYDTVEEHPGFEKIRDELKGKLLDTDWFDGVKNYCLNEGVLQLRSLIAGNRVELVRFEDDEAVLSEVKGKYGPGIDDTHLYFTKIQLKKLKQFSKAGINTTVILIIALDTPRFTEIPFERFDIPELEDRRDDRVKVRIPHEHREIEDYNRIPDELYDYEDLDSLIEKLKQRASDSSST